MATAMKLSIGSTVAVIAACFLGGCKLSVMVNEGGRVVALNTANGCAESTICSIDVTDPNFTESFTALANPGYEFVRWQNGLEFICGDSLHPTCTIAMLGSPIDQALALSFKTGYIMPVFKDIGIDTDGDGIRNELDDDDDNDGIFDVSDACPLDPDPLCGTGIPIVDTIEVGGLEWAQPDLFFGLEWADIDAVCNGGTCDGVLNGWNMTGWNWASIGEVNAMVNLYIGQPELDSEGTVQYSEHNSTWAPAFFADGWRPRQVSPIRDVPAYPSDLVEIVVRGIPFIAHVCLELVDWTEPFSTLDEYKSYTFDSCDTPIGAWIYREL